MIDIAWEWLGYLGRWSHVIAAITWIGTSFYFNWLDLSERPPKAPTLKPNVVGEVHEMHGGSFYYHERYWPTEDNPRTLAHSGPAQLTFVTGIFLVAYIYWLGAGVFLVPGSGSAVTPALAILCSAAVIFLPWFVYDFVCRHTFDDELVTMVMAVVVVATSYFATQVFSSRAAFVHIGAMLGTIMVANVHFVIVPNHIKMRGQVKAGEPVSDTFHKLAKRRSQHNNYFTLPVIFAMLSVHFPLVSTNEFAWATISLVCAAAFILRLRKNRYLVTERKDRQLAVLAAVLMGLAIATSAIPAKPKEQDLASLDPVQSEIFGIVSERCAICHSAAPKMEGFPSPPAGLRLETMADITAHKDMIFTVAIASDLMPPGNLTEMTEEERKRLADWLASVGARSVDMDQNK
ncbi:MAG: urate hydroxylase PuuD [Rhodobacterales bacterium]|nr:urate hydroxylase PuuD [Rhodobacterales bacterium]